MVSTSAPSSTRTTSTSTSTATPTPTLPPTIPPHNGTAPAGPLTTIFTPPVSCADNSTLYYRTSSCMPDNWDLYWNNASYYSPAICPSGMLSVATRPPFFGPPVEPGETAVVCCPTDYILHVSSSAHWCFGSSRAVQPNLVTVKTTFTSKDKVITTNTLSPSYVTTSFLNSIYPVQIRWRDSDLSILQTDPLTPGATYSATGNTTAAATATGSVQNSGSGTNNNGSHASLSAGAIAGIIIGSLLFGLIIAGFALPDFLLRRQRKEHPPLPQTEQRNTYQEPPDARHTHSTTSPVGRSPTPGEWQHHGPSPDPKLEPVPEDVFPEDVSGNSWFIETGDEHIDAELRKIDEMHFKTLHEVEDEDDDDDEVPPPPPRRARFSSAVVFHPHVEYGE